MQRSARLRSSGPSLRFSRSGCRSGGAPPSAARAGRTCRRGSSAPASCTSRWPASARAGTRDTASIRWRAVRGVRRDSAVRRIHDERRAPARRLHRLEHGVVGAGDVALAALAARDDRAGGSPIAVDPGRRPPPRSGTRGRRTWRAAGAASRRRRSRCPAGSDRPTASERAPVGADAGDVGRLQAATTSSDTTCGHDADGRPEARVSFRRLRSRAGSGCLASGQVLIECGQQHRVRRMLRHQADEVHEIPLAEDLQRARVGLRR